MTFCPKCGSKVEETMNFCPNCGIQLKTAAPSQPSPAAPPQEQRKPAENTRQTEQEKEQKHVKAEYGFMYYLVGGLVLITIGVFAILELTNPALTAGQYLIVMLLTIGVIVIAASIYVALSGRNRMPSKPSNKPAKKQPPPPPTVASALHNVDAGTVS